MLNDNGNGHARGVIQRVALAAMIIIGAFLIVLPLATNLPGKSAATGDMMTAFRPQMTDAALAQGAADQKTMSAMADQLSTAMLPALAQQMHMTPDQLNAYLASSYPNVAKGMQQLPTILPFFGSLQSTMAAQQANYQQADAIPTGFLPPTSMTWLFCIPGLLLVAFGVLGLARPSRARWTVVASGVVGAVVVVGLLGASMYSKASAADDMTVAFKPVFSAQGVAQARADTTTVAAMATEFTQKALPGLATGLGMSQQQLSAMLVQQFPAVATGVTQMPAVIQRMEAATSTIEANVDNYNQSTEIPWSPGSMVRMFWLMMVPGVLALAIAAVVGVLGLGRAVPYAAPRRPAGVAHH